MTSHSSFAAALPDDVLFEIFSRVSDERSLLGGIGLVSKIWNNVALSDIVRRAVRANEQAGHVRSCKTCSGKGKLSNRFMKAIKDGKFECVKYLAEQNQSLSIVGLNGVTALHGAVKSVAVKKSVKKSSALRIVKYLVEVMGMDVNAEDEDGLTPVLMSATHLPLLKYFVDEHHGNISKTCYGGETILHIAAFRKTLTPEFLQYTVREKNVDVSAADDEGDTVLHRVACLGTPRIFDLLVTEYKMSHDIDNLNEDTPMLAAAASGNVAMVQHIVDKYDVDPEESNIYGKSALHLAAKNGHVNVIKYLLDKKGVDIDIEDCCCETPLDQCRRAVRKGEETEEILEAMLLLNSRGATYNIG